MCLVIVLVSHFEDFLGLSATYSAFTHECLLDFPKGNVLCQGRHTRMLTNFCSESVDYLTMGGIDNQQSTVDQGQINNQQLFVDQGQINDQQSTVDQGQINDQQSSVHQGQINDQQSTVDQGQINNQHC